MNWLRRRLFATPLDAALTLASLFVLYLVVPPVVKWAFVDATWVGATRADCVTDGACWLFVKARFVGIDVLVEKGNEAIAESARLGRQFEHRRHDAIVRPPSTTMVWPVM